MNPDHEVQEYEIPLRPAISTGEAVNVVREASVRMSASQHYGWWLERLELAANLLEWYGKELAEVRRIAEQEAAEIHALLDQHGVRPYAEILGGHHILQRIMEDSTFDTVVRLREALEGRNELRDPPPLHELRDMCACEFRNRVWDRATGHCKTCGLAMI